MNYQLKDRFKTSTPTQPPIITSGIVKPDTPKTEDKPKWDYSQYESSSYTDNEQEKMLLGYDSVPQEAWELLKPGTHIRYKTIEGNFRRGGFVHNVKSKGTKMIFLETNRKQGTPGYAKWPVAFDSIDTLWKKRSLEDVRINESRTDVGPRQLEMESRLVMLEQHVDRLSEDLKKLIKTIGVLAEKIGRTSTPMVGRLSPVNVAPRR
jgi:hypothetical protein